MSLSGTILSAVGAAGQLFAGYGSITLGPIQFRGLAKPRSMPIGGRQAVTTHKLPGGGRVIDAMGPDNADIAWSGYLDGVDANIIARALDKLRQSGQVVPLAWDVFSYNVLVTEFRCEIRHTPMPYKINCTVVSDNSQVSAIALISLASQVAADLLDGNPIAALSTATQAIVGDVVSVASTSAGNAGATIVGSNAYAAAIIAVQLASSTIDVATNAANSVLLPIGLSLNSLSVAPPIDVDIAGMSNEIVTATSACGDLAQLATATGYVNRAAANLQRASA